MRVFACATLPGTQHCPCILDRETMLLTMAIGSTVIDAIPDELVQPLDHLWRSGCGRQWKALARVDHFVNQAIFLGLLRRHEKVAVAVFLNPLQRLGLLAVQGTLKSLLQNHSSK